MKMSNGKLAFEPITEDVLLQYLSGQTGTDNLFRTLKGRNSDYWRHQLVVWTQKRENSLTGGGQEKIDRQYRRFKVCCEEIKRQPLEQIRRGLNTAFKVIWGIAQIIPDVYENQFGRKISEEEYANCITNSLPLKYETARMRLDYLGRLDKELEKTGSDANLGLDVGGKILEEKDFYFENSEKGPILEIKPDVLAQIPKSQDVTTPVTSCPALYALGINKKNIIAELDELVLEYLKKFYFPIFFKQNA
jgi:hypothetical protein